MEKCRNSRGERIMSNKKIKELETENTKLKKEITNLKLKLKELKYGLSHYYETG